MEEITCSFWSIMLLQIDWTIAIDAIFYKKWKHCLLFVNVHYIFSNIDKNAY